MKTKFLSLFLSLIMVLSCFGAALPAFAEEAAGGETETTDYDALAVAAGYVARIGTPEEAYADGAMTGYYKNLAANQKGYVSDEDAEYASAHDAAKTLGKDTVVYLLTDLEFTNILKMDAEYTLDGQGHCISGQYHQKIVDIQSTEGNGVTIKNLKIWQKGQHGMVQVTGVGAKGTLENCYLLGTGVTTGGVIVNAQNQSITIKGCTIKIVDPAPVFGLGMISDTGVRLAYDNQTVVIENSVIDCSENFGGTGFHLRNEDAHKNTAHNSATITNCYVIAQGSAIDAKDCNVTINGGTFITTLGASAGESEKELSFDAEGNPVWEKGAKNDDGTWKDTVDADGNKLDENGNKIQAKQSVKVMKDDNGCNTPATGVTKKFYTAYDAAAIQKGRGGNFTINGTVKLQGGTSGLFFDDDDLAVGSAVETPDPNTVHNVTALAYAIGETSLTYSDEAEAAQIAAGMVAYTFNEDGTKTYYKNLSPVDSDYVAADGNAMQDAAGKTIYLISDVQFKNSANKASDMVIGAPGSENKANAGAAGFVNQDVVINGMGFTINTRGYICVQPGGKLTISNATVTTTSEGRHMFQVNAKNSSGLTGEAVLNLTNVDLVANCKLNGGFFVARGVMNFDDVTWTYAENYGADATQIFHLDDACTLTLNNCRVDSTTNAPKAGLFMKTVTGAVINITGNSDIAFAKYGVVGAGTAGAVINVTENAVVRSLDNAFVIHNEGDVINVTDNAKVISTNKDAIKLVGKNSVANITDNATVEGGRRVLYANGEGSTFKVDAGVTVTLNEIVGTSVAAVDLEGKATVLNTTATITAATVPAIVADGEGAVALVKGGTITGSVVIGATDVEATLNMFAGTIDAGAATTAAVVVNAGDANIYGGTVKGGTAPVTGETYAAETTEKVYDSLTANVPTNGEISLRMNAESEGMRFASSVSKEVNDFAKAMLDAGVIADYQFGTLIVRKTELANKEFTVEAFAAADVPYAAITADSGLVVNDDGSLSYTAAIVNFKTDNYGTTLIARAYIAYTLTDGSVLYFYAEEAEDGTSLAKLAEKALADVKMESEEGYRNFVTSYYKENAQGKLKPYTGNAYAPYSKAQQALLNAYIAEA